MRTRRVGPGSYVVTDGDLSVTVTRLPHLTGPQWVAAAEWDRFNYTDPLWTKRDAVAAAHHMIGAPHS